MDMRKQPRNGKEERCPLVTVHYKISMTSKTFLYATFFIQNVVGADLVLWYLNPGGQHWTLLVMIS